MNRNARWIEPAIVLGIFLLNAALNAPLFLPGELPFRESIEAGYASMARYFAGDPNPWGWNPTQYLGLPAQLMYVPLAPYLAALLTWVFSFPPEYAHRLLMAAGACLGPATVYLFVRYFTGSRWWALATAVGYTFWSPLYYLYRPIDADRGLVPLPWRIQVLAKYGEGPHNFGLTLLPLTLAAVHAAAARGRFPRIFAAAVLMAAVTLTNLVAGLALAWCCLMFLVATFRGWETTGLRPLPVLAAAGLAYLLACFWLTPGFLDTFFLNWPKDAYNYRFREQQELLLAGLLAGVLLWRLLFIRSPKEWYLCFLFLVCFGFGYVVTGFYVFRLDTIPESRRYAVEFEMFAFILMFEMARRTLEIRRRWLQAAAGVIALVCLAMGARPALRYAAKSFEQWRPVPKETTIEFQVARRLAFLNPRGRVFVSGGTRFRLNSWYSLHQVGGGFESGLHSRTPLDWIYQIRTGIGSEPGEAGRDAIRQLRLMAVEYLAVHGPKSREYYRDNGDPRRFEGLLEVVWREGDDWIFRVPFHSFAHLVRSEELPESWRFEYLAPYVAALDDPARPRLKTRWAGTSELHIDGPAPEGMSVSVQVNYHPGWRAIQNGEEIPVEKDAVNYIVLRPYPSERAHIELRFRGTAEQRVFAAVSALAWLGSLGALAFGLRRRPAAV